MEASRWTDARIDDLNDRVSGVAADVRHQSDRIDALQHTIVVVGGMITIMLMVNLIPVLYSFYGHRQPPEGAGVSH